MMKSTLKRRIFIVLFLSIFLTACSPYPTTIVPTTSTSQSSEKSKTPEERSETSGGGLFGSILSIGILVALL